MLSHHMTPYPARKSAMVIGTPARAGTGLSAEAIDNRY
jgi:hypothetical protein